MYMSLSFPPRKMFIEEPILLWMLILSLSYFIISSHYANVLLWMLRFLDQLFLGFLSLRPFLATTEINSHGALSVLSGLCFRLPPPPSFIALDKSVSLLSIMVPPSQISMDQATTKKHSLTSRQMLIMGRSTGKEVNSHTTYTCHTEIYIRFKT